MTNQLRKILYVEDEPDIQAIARISLETLGGFEVMMCGSGAEALKNAADFAPDIFLLDAMLPEMDGPAILLALRAIEQFTATPTIFVTAKAMAPEVARFKQLGAVDVIAKPFDPMKLPDQIREIWARIHG